ncbi:hypothetical protein [Devosia sp. A16]|uniref:hypothetical protein n=1 Tax=Devosia sp. A16 TaxID=1736675 RepID=UPI0006D7BF0A|nr:hypothetical protein [Devosia sp. A16]
MALAAIALAWPFAAYADPPPLDDLQKAFFHISVSGEAAEGAVAGNRQGKAFAIGPSLIVTSRHLLGADTDWKPRDDLAAEVIRATGAVARTIELIPATADTPADLGINALVSQEQGSATDIAEISLPDAHLEPYFGLSMCDIQVGQTYGVLLGTREPPTDPRSVKHAGVAKLSAVGFDVPEYGGLFVFDVVEDNPAVQWESDGHEGSPIIDGDGNVVGIVSAIELTSGGDHRILATPIQSPLLSAISAVDQGPPGPKSRSIKCSLADTVKRINDQVLAYATWTAEVARDKDGKPSGQLLLKYESVADYPNIDTITIEYDYWGKQRGGDETRVTRLQYYNDDPNELPLKGSLDDKVFDASDIIDEGTRQLQRALDKKGEGGSIQYVEIRIIGTKLTDGRDIRKVTTLRFDWRQP